METTSEKESHLCTHCDKVILGNKYHFEAHLYQHKMVNPRFECKRCYKQYYRKDCFMRHMNSHTGGNKRKYVCDYCDRGFVDKRNLENHLKVHEDNKIIKRYDCMACGMRYCEERLLRYHIRKDHFNLHQKEVAYEKKKLNETWIEPVLETQVYVQMTKVNNNVIRIKKCDIIKTEDSKDVKDFKTDSTGFDEYMNSVFACSNTSQYSKAVCNYCNKEMLKKSLHSHIRERHLKLKKFACDICKRSFNRHYQLVDHKCGNTRRRRKQERTS